MCSMLGCCFFFSSRRRHTRCSRDWSSDVCSSDLGLVLGAILWVLAPQIAGFFRIPAVEPVLRTFAWTFPLAGLSLVAYAVTQRALRFRWLAIVDVVSFGVGYGVVGVTLALLGFGVWALVAAEMSKVGLYTIILVAAHPPRFTF